MPCGSLTVIPCLIAASLCKTSLSPTQIWGKDYQLSLATPVTRYQFTSSVQSLIPNQIAMRHRQSVVDSLLPIKSQLFVWSESHLSRCLNASSAAHPPARTHVRMHARTHKTTNKQPMHTHTVYTHALYITALIPPTLCNVRNFLSLSTHQKVLRWNANNVIYVAWLFHELGNRFNFSNCTNMHSDIDNPRTTTTCLSLLLASSTMPIRLISYAVFF